MSFAYRNLKSLESNEELEKLYQRTQELRRYEVVLTMLLAGAFVICIALITYLTTIMAQPQGDEMNEFSSSSFATKLYNVLRSTPGNVFFSPYSLQVALAMTYSGAGGNTAVEMQRAVPFTEDRSALNKAVRASSASLRSSQEVTLNIANGMFLQKDYPVKASYGNSIKEVFEGEAKTVDFAKNQEAANEINTFVNGKTNGKIQKLFTPNAFNSLTRMVLVNAIYFKGAWLNKFDPNDTVKGDFHLNSKDKVQVDYMTISKKFNVVESAELKSTIVELPYVSDLSMVLVVPNEIEGIKHVEEKFKDLNLATILNDSDSREVNLKMPKFKLEQKLELVDTLKTLGIKDMFDEKAADFSGITDRRDIYVSQVVQKAFIEVNEEGSEAAAATAVKFVFRSMPMPPKVVHVRAPFIFLLRHARGPILFAGRVSKP